MNLGGSSRRYDERCSVALAVTALQFALGVRRLCVRNCFRVGVGVAGQKYPYENGYRAERTVKNWLSGLYGPCGTNLVV
jgi:hypothetical protein